MTQTSTGWILDVYIEDNEAVLWIKTDNGLVLKLIDNYEPVFYIQPKNDKSGIEIFKILKDLELVKEIRWDYKLIDIDNKVKQKLLYVRCYLIHHYNLLLKVLQHETLASRINQLFNTRLSHIQRYLFTQLMVRPTSKVNVEYEDGNLLSIIKSNDNENSLLPLSIMHLEIIPFTEQELLDRDDPIRSITVSYCSEDLLLEDSESKMLEEFSNYVISKDPDIIIFKNHGLSTLNYLLERVRMLSLNLQFGRRKTDIYSIDQNHIVDKWTQGRVYIGSRDHGQNDIVALSELSQFSCLPLRMILKYSIGRLIANRNLYELIFRGRVISDNYNQRTYEHIRTLEEIVDKDKAGMIFSPLVGLHENVAVLDYNDEFANIIINNNISYETLTQQNESSLGILPNIVKWVLERRIHFRQLSKELPEDSVEASNCERVADTLKKILVCLYGTTGSYWNKYGNILAFEQINKKSREILLKTKDIVQGLGFDLIYADTDAAFVHKDNATKDDYENLGTTLSRETGLALTLEYHYKFLVLLPLEADEKLEALKHYFGITYDKELITRGIETRRHDTPKFIKEFQKELLYTLFDAANANDILDRTLEHALFCVTKTIDKIMTGEIEQADLIISKQLRMDITKYRSLFPHVAAAIQLSKANGKPASKGDIIQYIYTDSQHQNPINRVVTTSSDTNFGRNYDREKYKEMLLDAAETTLGIFGFSRELYGKPNDKKWWMELRRNRMNDVQAETGR